MSRITIDVLERQAEAMGLKVLESDIPGTACGLYCDRLRTIWLADWLNDRQRLCTLCHELVHAKYRDLGCGTRFGVKCERRARRETALMLISPAEFAMSEDRNSLHNQSLEKGLSVLKAFSAQRRSMSLAEVAEAAGMTKSSAQRMVFTLESLGYLRKHSRTRHYQLTPRVLELGFSYLDAHSLIEVANPFLSELTRLTGETSCLTEPAGYDMTYIARFVSAGFVPVRCPCAVAQSKICSMRPRTRVAVSVFVFQIGANARRTWAWSTSDTATWPKCGET